MGFHNRDGEDIASLNAWHRLAKPAAEHHWKEGRSAYELAKDWIEGDAIDRVTRLLRSRPELAGAQLDELPRGPRNHDLLVRGMTPQGPVVIGVEGKADEPFDKSLGQWREAAMDRTPTSDAPRRLDHLTNLFFGTTIDRDAAYPPLSCLGYQLLSALAGTLADAKESAAAHAVLLVHEFVTDETDDVRHAANEKALDDFLVRLGVARPERPDADVGWITHPLAVRGDGSWMPASLPVFIAKLVTRRR
jgi:hypothetical protein